MPSPETKELYTMLLASRYIRNRMNNEGRSVVCVYEGKQVPVKSFPAAAGNELKHLLKGDKKDKFRFTLNLNKVRRLGGRVWFKKAFKIYKKNTL